MITPKELKKKYPIPKEYLKNISQSKKTISEIINKKDKKLLIICGPCSIHDIYATIDYGRRLKSLSQKLEDKIYIVMRAYLEKPRTSIGWKGIINDPYINNSYRIEEGLKISRKLLIELIKINIPIATEILSPNIIYYINDTLSWAAIGARTTESQIHREIASELQIPIGFKNSVDGSINSAINSIISSSIQHHFININNYGKISIIHSKGNKENHLILRGGNKPNFYPENIEYANQIMIKSKVNPAIIIDCSHGNSNKEHNRQINVANSVIEQINSGSNSIIGIMLESNIHEGNQNFNIAKENMKYGVSITDPCIDWITTKNLLTSIYDNLHY